MIEKVFAKEDLEKMHDYFYFLMTEFQKVLDQKSWEILSHRYGLYDSKPKTLEDVGKMFDSNREKIRQTEAKSIRLLADAIIDDENIKNKMEDVKSIFYKYKIFNKDIFGDIYLISRYETRYNGFDMYRVGILVLGILHYLEYWR